MGRLQSQQTAFEEFGRQQRPEIAQQDEGAVMVRTARIGHGGRQHGQRTSHLVVVHQGQADEQGAGPFIQRARQAVLDPSRQHIPDTAVNLG